MTCVSAQKAGGKGFMIPKKEVFIFERWWWFCNMPTPVTAQPRPSRVREWSDTKGLVSNLVFWSFSPLHSTKTDRIKSFWILKLIREETEILNKHLQKRPSKSNRTYPCSWIMKAMILFYVLVTFYILTQSVHNFEFESIIKNNFGYWKETGSTNENTPIRPIQLNLLPYRCISRVRWYHKH